MVITVRFIGALRSVSGKSKCSIKADDGASVREVLDKLVEEKPKLRRALIDSELDDPRPNALILVNGKDISVLNGLETLLKSGDEVVFVPVLHGG
jgi:molybdopterin synthase sulfur carrier subunit